MGSSNYSQTTTFLQQLADEALLEVSNSRSSIWGLVDPGTAYLGMREPSLSLSVSRPTLQSPPQLSDFLGSLNGSSVDGTLSTLNTQANAWLAKYFPSLDSCLSSIPDEFLCGVISGIKPFGLDSTVFDLVWHRARDRAYRTMQSEQRQIESSFAGRGFTIPPGAMIAAVSDSMMRADAAILDVNREQAIKDAEIRLELLKFAEEQALNYKRGILQQLADFYRVWVSLPDKDLERSRIKVQAMTSLYSALSSFYDVELAYDKLALAAKQANVETDLAVDKNRIAARAASETGGKAAALGQAARAFGDVAAQAASSAGTLTAQIESF